ncbi:hypothetical protein N7493_007306 [Penicillium malachiteum]|uniref:RNase H type-1 domain-containing protein n=1 Tax=Penicillium malachiteum TaxID=1324776 RepID=A0AAD6HJU1_9EURO|nr:hypothetical protein N7493_007306 [Penicillium malachiteum]
MVYKMVMYTDGGCRYNRGQDLTGAAAAVTIKKDGGSLHWTRLLPPEPKPTSQRAEIHASPAEVEEIEDQPLPGSHHTHRLKVCDRLHDDLDSQVETEWMDCQGQRVANKNLIWRASRLQNRVRKLGDLEYVWIPRRDNEEADDCAASFCTTSSEDERNELD